MAVSWKPVGPRLAVAKKRPDVPVAPVLPTTVASHAPAPVRGVMVYVHALFGKLKAFFGPKYQPKDAATPQARAKETWDAMQAKLGLAPDAGIYAEHAGGLTTATVWPYGQALAAALDLAQLDGNYGQAAKLAKGLSNFTKDGAYAPGPWGGNRLWDDNAWVGLDLLQAYQQTKDKRYLDQAEALYPFFVKGLSKQGGIYWEEKNPRMSLNSCANGPTAEFALRTYMATKDPKYLALAKNVDAVLNGKLRSPEGLYYDNLGDDGSLDKSIFSYNQGAAMGADVLWFKLTGDQKYLDRAKQTAKASLDYFGKDDRLWKQSPAFNAIFFRNLLALDAVAPDPAYRKALDGYLDRAWTQGRDSQTGLFTKGGIGSYTAGKADLLDQAGLAQLYALKAWPKEELAKVS